MRILLVVLACLSGGLLTYEAQTPPVQAPLTYYVSEKGTNENTGQSPATPLRTISEAVRRMKAGDRCLIMEGTYRETVTVRTSKITLQAQPGANVIVSGLDKVGPWKLYREKIYQASFTPAEKDSSASAWHLGGKGKYFTQVFANGTVMTQGRYPNATGNILQWEHHGGAVTIFPGGKFEFSGASRQTWPAGYWQGAVAHAIVEKKYNAVQGVVGPHAANELLCTDMTEGWKKSTPQKFRDYLFTRTGEIVNGVGRGFITNHLNAVDAPGEWHWNKKSNVLYFIPPDGRDPNQLTVEAKSRKQGLVLSGCTDVVVKGITFHAAGVEMANTTRCALNHCTVTYPVPFYTHMEEYNGKAAVNIEGNANRVQNCRIAHSWGSGAEIVGGTDNIFENNLVEDVNWMGTYNACLRAGGTGTRILNNTLRHSGRFLIQGTGIKKGVIRYNDLYEAMLIGQDGGGFYTYVQDGEETEIAFNWVHHIRGVPWERSEHTDHNVSVGIYLDGGCQRFNVHHNVIWDTKYGIMFNATPGPNQKPSKGNKMNYNTCRVSGTSAIVSKNLPDLYEHNEASFNYTNRKVSGLAEKKGNVLDDTLTPPSRRTMAKQKASAEVGAYAHPVKPWVPGADTTKIF